MAESGARPWRTRWTKRRQRLLEAAGGAASPAVLGQLRQGDRGRRGFERSRRPHAPSRMGEAGPGRRRPQAVAGRQRGVEELGRPQTLLGVQASEESIQLWRHRRGNPETAQGWHLSGEVDSGAGRRRRTVTGTARRRRMGSRIEQRTRRWGKPPTGGRPRRKHAARKGNAARTRRTATACATLPAGDSKQGMTRRGSECNRGTGGGKTARPGLHGGAG
jgi:hypothetical protein